MSVVGVVGCTNSKPERDVPSVALLDGHSVASSEGHSVTSNCSTDRRQHL